MSVGGHWANPLGVDIETEAGETWCVAHAGNGGRSARMGTMFENEYDHITPVFHNAGYDLSYLDPGHRIIPQWHDTIIEAHLLGHKPLNLRYLSSVFLGIELDKSLVQDSLAWVKSDGKKGQSFDMNRQKTLEMGSLDAYASFALHNLWKDQVSPRFDSILETERDITKVLMDMKRKGLPVSQSKLKSTRTLVMKKLGAAEAILLGAGLDPLNIKQFANWFWRGKAPVTTKEGDLCTKAKVLRDHMRPDQEVVTKAYITWKTMDKFRSTYLDAWAGQDWVHASLNHTGTATWRYSSSDPNLQNVPRDEDIPLYNLFEAPEGWTFLSFDYSQLELRILANLSGDENMQRAYLSGRDLHQETQTMLENMHIFSQLGVPEIHKRTFAKTVNFGIAYGITAWGLSTRLNISEEAAQILIDAFYANYPGVIPWCNEQYAFAEEHGYINTFLDRPIYVPGMLVDDGPLRGHAEKQTVNAPVQGGATEIVKEAMRRAPEYLVMQVHDELLYLCPTNEVAELKAHLEEVLQDYRHTVPYTAKAKVGQTWGEIKDIAELWDENAESDIDD